MKTENKKNKTTTEQLREIRDNISHDIQNMSFKELQKYIADKATLHSKSLWDKK